MTALRPYMARGGGVLGINDNLPCTNITNPWPLQMTVLPCKLLKNREVKCTHILSAATDVIQSQMKMNFLVDQKPCLIEYLTSLAKHPQVRWESHSVVYYLNPDNV